MINIATIIICLLFGFILGIAFVVINRFIVLRRKTIKQKSFGTRERDKKMVADSKFLKQTKEQHASGAFRE